MPGSTVKSLRLEDDLIEQLDLLAGVLNTTFSEVVRVACVSHLTMVRESPTFGALVDKYLERVRRTLGGELRD